MAEQKYIVNREYLKGWQGNLIGFFVIMIAFFCFEPDAEFKDRPLQKLIRDI